MCSAIANGPPPGTLESGNFIYATCRQAGFRSRSYIQNTPRDNWRDAEAAPLQVSLQVFRDGRLYADRPSWAEVPFMGYVEIIEDEFISKNVEGSEFIFVVRCERPASRAGYFAQEHQLIYEHGESGRPCTVLFDQMPRLAPHKTPSPVILLAPKLWLGGDRDTHLIVAGYNDREVVASPFEFLLFTQEGQLVGSRKFEQSHNRGLAIDGRGLLPEAMGKEARLYTALGRGGCGSYTFVSLSRNASTGTSMVEHSLSPHYYISGDRAAMRNAVLDHREYARGRVGAH